MQTQGVQSLKQYQDTDGIPSKNKTKQKKLKRKV
jgi:hypothetical protein